MKKLRIVAGVLVIALIALWSCERPRNPVSEGVLGVSADTVKFDSIFTTFLSPSERLWLYNNTGRAVSIDRVWLELEDDSEFSLVVDGIPGQSVEELILANNDSLLVFINLASELKDDFALERLHIEIGDGRQTVILRAKVIDAYFLRARVRQEGAFVSLDTSSFFFQRDTVLTPEKPIIMDGPIFIPEGVTVTILPGTELFFTPYKFGLKDSSGVPVFGFYSTLIVDGTLVSEGMPGAPIIFQGSRFDSLYQENPAQWRGINFRKNSRDNLLRHTVVKNALIGVQVDSISLNQNPKLTLDHAEIRNMGAFGLVGLGFDPSGMTANSAPAIFMENSIINTCKERTLLLVAGGKYEFYNSTFANYNLSRFSRRTPQVLIRNWFTFDGVTADVYPSYTDFTNCIFWGSEEDEVVIDTLQGAPFDRLVFDHSLLRLSEENQPAILPHTVDCLINEDPLFNDFFVRDYRPREGSPVIDAGLDPLPGSTGYIDDFRGQLDSLRTSPFDIGAYEYFPLEE